jgi:hypothetical protein
MSNRFILDKDGLRGDRIMAMAIDGQPIQGSRPTLSITGIVNGDDGVLLVHLPGMVPRYYALQPGAARAMRDAMIACVTDDPEQFEALQRQRYVVERTLG